EPCAAVDKRWIIDSMIGAGHAELEDSYLSDIPLHSRRDTPVVLTLQDLGCNGAYDDVSLKVHEGEILGIFGFLGSGQLELARTLFGRLPGDRGEIRLAGRTVHLSLTTRAKRAGMAFLPESRRMMLFAAEPVFKNMMIAILDRIDRLW